MLELLVKEQSSRMGRYVSVAAAGEEVTIESVMRRAATG